MPNVDEILSGAREAISVTRVFGEPVEREDITLVPAAAVRGGAGGGSDREENGGGRRLRSFGEPGRRLRDQGWHRHLETGREHQSAHSRVAARSAGRGRGRMEADAPVVAGDRLSRPLSAQQRSPSGRQSPDGWLRLPTVKSLGLLRTDARG